ncbi:MAG: class I SAM-dependent methyltransferase [Methylococcaceae bacterium]|nr:class I SAM-dependent methyltransferase [Methylococcaceae bacterium]
MLKLLFQSTRDRGFLETVRLVPKNLVHVLRLRYDGFFDRKFGTDTDGIVELIDLDIGSENLQYGVWYEPTSTRIFSHILAKLPSTVGLVYEDYVYIDYGSGKGRTLLLASEFPFAEIIGIEFSRKLCSVAQNNIAVYRSKRQKCKKIRSVCVDVVDYRLASKYSVCFFYNPFAQPVLHKVIDGIKTNLNEMQGRVIIVYYNPIHAKYFDECGLFSNKIIINLPFDLAKNRQNQCYIYTTA